jgi:polysaccharide chain length determinant protein (PEP-CTERM system associated)
MRRPPTEISDYVEILKRRWHLVVIPVLASLFLTIIVGSKLPKYYVSETVVMLDPQKVPLDVVKSGQLDLAQRLQLINQQILSRTQLEKIVSTFGLYKDGGSKDEIIDRMRKDIALEVVRDRRIQDSDVTAFKLSYTARSPELAQSVTRQLGSLYIEENLKVREQIAEGTHEFIDEELTKARDDLQKQEQAMSKFKSEHMGALPQQENSNLQLIGQYQALLQANAEAITRAQQNKQYLQSLLEVNNSKPADKMGSLESARTELAAAEQRYTPSHPDVIRLRSLVKSLEQQQANSTKENSTPQLTSQIAGLDEEIKDRTQRAKDIEAKVRSVQGRVEALPMIEQQFTELSRDYEVSKANYQALLQKKNQTGMTVEMERGAKGENFRILDPATLPQKPTKPNMGLVLASGLGLGLVIGGSLGAIREYQDRSVHSEQDLQYYLRVPVLALMPVIHTQQSWDEQRKANRKKWMISGASLATAALVLVALMIRGTVDLSTWF